MEEVAIFTRPHPGLVGDEVFTNLHHQNVVEPLELMELNRHFVTPPEFLLTYETANENAEPEASSKVSDLKNAIWEDVNVVHPMLDFKNGVAYVAVQMDFDAPPIIESCPYTITSDGSFFESNNMGEVAKRGLRYSRPILSVPNRWKKAHLKEYLEGIANLNLPRLFIDIKGQFRKYVRFEEQSTYSFMALWTIGTYLHPIFQAYPMVLLCGPKGSGKTRTLQVATLLAFNARLQGDPTPATLFRSIDEERPTLLFDEMEWLSKKDLQCALSSILKFGYKPGCKVPRCGYDAKGKPSGITSFDSYCPKMFANIHGLEDVLGDRTITFIQRRKKPEDNIENTDPSESDHIWSRLRHNLYVFTLTHWQTVKECIPTGNLPVSNRDLELFSAVLALARFFEDKAGITGLYNEMIELATNKASERRESDKELGHDAILIQALLNIVDQEKWFSVAEIIKEFRKFFMGNSDWVNDVWAGRTLTRLGIGKAQGTKERKWGRDELSKPNYLTHYFITRLEVEALAERYGIEFLPQNVARENNPFSMGHI